MSPRKDLPDLIPFFHGMLVRNRRRPDREDGVFSFRTPEEWLKSPGIRMRYEGLVFSRQPRDDEEAKRIVGVGHQVFDQALTQALDWEGTLACLRECSAPLAVFQIQDAVTGQGGQVSQGVAGITTDDADKPRLLRDEDLLELLNRCKPGPVDLDGSPPDVAPEALTAWLDQARNQARMAVDRLRLPFVKPILSDLALFWPGKCDTHEGKDNLGEARAVGDG